MDRVAWKRVFTVSLCITLCLTGCSQSAVPVSQPTEKPDFANAAVSTPSLQPTQSTPANPAATSEKTYPLSSPDRKQTETGAVAFQDEGIENAVRVALAQIEGDITPDDMLMIIELEIEGFTEAPRVRSLVDLAWAENLESLSISVSALTSLHGIENLVKLKQLTIWNSGLRDITSLARLANLETLSLDRNKIIFIDVINELCYLSLRDNHVRDISPVLGRTGFVYVDLRNETVDKDQYRRFLTEGAPYTIMEHKRLHVKAFSCAVFASFSPPFRQPFWQSNHKGKPLDSQAQNADNQCFFGDLVFFITGKRLDRRCESKYNITVALIGAIRF